MIILMLCLSKNEAIKHVAIVAFVLIAVIEIFSYQMDFYPCAAVPWDPQGASKGKYIFPVQNLRSMVMPDLIKNDEEIFRIRMVDVYDASRFSQINKIFSLGYGGSVAVARLSNFRKTFENPSPPYNFLDPGSVFLDFYNVKYLYSKYDLENFSVKYKKIQGSPNWYINSRAFPRAFCVNKFKVIKNDDLILKAMLSYDMKEYVILSEDPDLNSASYSDMLSNCKITKFSNNQVDIETHMQNPGFLVISDLWYPGWRAYLDGEATKLYRANYTFKAVEVPEGFHRVKFIFNPGSFKLGMIVSIGTLLLTLFLAIALKRNEK